MTSGLNDTSDAAIEQIERGLEAYFVGDAARRLLEAIDWEALIEGTPVEEPVDYKHVGEVVGRLMARTIIKDLSRSGRLGQVIETTIGQEIGDRLGGAAVEALIESGTPEAIAEFGDELTATTRDIGLQDALADLRLDVPEWDEETVTTIEVEEAPDAE